MTLFKGYVISRKQGQVQNQALSPTSYFLSPGNGAGTLVPSLKTPRPVYSKITDMVYAFTEVPDTL